MGGVQPDLVQVKIYDREYSLRTSGNPEHLHELCEALDKRMREVAHSTGTVDTLKVAILTALNLAEELWRVRHEMQQIDESLSRRSKECVSMLDRFLY